MRSLCPVTTGHASDGFRAGTWTKTSRVVGPRTPFGRETALLRYDYDSEDEWEEEPDDPEAEDVGSEGELSAEDSDALSDDWMCDDDEVDYLPGHGEEDDIKMEVDGDSDVLIIESDSMARKKVLDREKKAKAAKEAQRKKNAGPLLPLVLGPTWESNVGQTTKAFKSMRIQFLNGQSSRLLLSLLLSLTPRFLQTLTMDSILARSSRRRSSFPPSPKLSRRPLALPPPPVQPSPRLLPSSFRRTSCLASSVSFREPNKRRRTSSTRSTRRSRSTRSRRS